MERDLKYILEDLRFLIVRKTYNFFPEKFK